MNKSHDRRKKIVPDSWWLVRIDCDVTSALVEIESGSRWPYPICPFNQRSGYVPSRDWFEMPPVEALELRIGYFQEGGWNEAEQADRWSLWDECDALGCARLTLAISSAIDKFNAMALEPGGGTLEFRVANLNGKLGPYAPQTERNAASSLRKKIDSWIADRENVRESKQYSIWLENVRRSMIL